MATIARHWRGLARNERADDYVAHLRGETFPQLQALPGLLESSILRRQLPEGTEFVVVTVWSSMDAIRAFAGDSIEEAVVPQAVRDMMLEWDTAARHYEVHY